MTNTLMKYLGLFLLVAAFGFSGCATTENMEISNLKNQLNEKDQEVATLKSSSMEKDKAISSYRGKIDEQSKTISTYESKLDAQSKATADAEMRAKAASEKTGTELLPPNAKTGECYARVFVPPNYRTTSERVLKHGEYEKVQVIPARYEWVEERILVKEASSRMETVPAKYEWVEENVLVKPAHTVWKKGRGPIEKVDHATGEIMCLVEVPAVYKTVKKRMMVKPPATRKVEVPAVYKTVKVRKMVSAPMEKRVTVPAEYQTITRTEQVSDGRMAWRRILCETNVSSDVISRIQTSLKNRGHDPGPVDGILGWRTNAAVKSYQKDKGLATGGLTYETMRSLGVEIGRY